MERGLGIAPIASGTGVQQLMNRLTDHLCLYHKTEASSQVEDPTSKQKAAVVQWFVGLTVEQRQEILLVKDREWVAVLMQMQRKLVESGPTNFFLMLDMGDPGVRSTALRSLVPELLCRRPVGLLARLDAQNTAGRELTDSLYFFSSKTTEWKHNGVPSVKKGGSKKGKKEDALAKKGEKLQEGHALVAPMQAVAKQKDELDVMVMSTEFLENPQRLMQLLDCLTLGQSLQEPCWNQAPGSWDETPWLHSMGYCALPYYIANRIELAIWSAWLKRTSSRDMRPPSLTGLVNGKVPLRSAKPSKTSQLQSTGPSAVSSLEKQRTLQTWWQKLDAGEKSQVLRAGVASLARHLAAESIRDAHKCKDLKERGLNPAVLDELGSRRQGLVLRASQQELASSRKALQKVPWIAGLLALRELSESDLLPARAGLVIQTSEKKNVSGDLVGLQSVDKEQGLKVRGEDPGQRDLEKDLHWILLSHGRREKGHVNSEGAMDGLFCPGLEVSCTLRGRLLSRLRHLVQELMHEHFARDLLGSSEPASLPSNPGKALRTASQSSKAGKKKSVRSGGVSGLPASNGTRRSAQEESISPAADVAPGVASRVEDRSYAQPAKASSSSERVQGVPEGVETAPLIASERGEHKSSPEPKTQQQSVNTTTVGTLGSKSTGEVRCLNTPPGEATQRGLKLAVQVSVAGLSGETKEPRTRDICKGGMPNVSTSPRWKEQQGSIEKVQVSVAGLSGGEEGPATRGPGSLNETDDEERRSSSGEAWEEVGAAKRRKDRRRRTDDKDAKREPRKRAAQPLEAPWMVSSGHVAPSGGVDAEGEHRKRRRRRKGKERKKEDAGDGRLVGADPRGLEDGGPRQKGEGVPGADGGDVREKPFEMQRHRGWNLAAPVFEPRSSLTSASRGVASAGLATNQTGLAARTTALTAPGVNRSGIFSSLRASPGVLGGGINWAKEISTGVRNGPGSVEGATGGKWPSPGSPQGAFKRSLSAGNAPGDDSPDRQSSTADSKRADTSGPPLVVPITPLKPAQRSQRVSVTRPPGLSDGSGASVTARQSAVPTSEEARHRCHEWPQFPGGLAMPHSAKHSGSQHLYPATPARTKPPAADGPVQMAGFVVQNPRLEHLSGTRHSQPQPPMGWAGNASSGPQGSFEQPVAANHTPSPDRSTGHNILSLPGGMPALKPQAAPAFAPPVPFSDTGTIPKSSPFRTAADRPPAFVRPVAIHRSRSSHQLPDNGYPVEPPGPVWEADHFTSMGRGFSGGSEQGSGKAPDPWPVSFQPDVRSLSPEAHWPPILPRITVPTADYFTDEDWVLGGGEETEGSVRNGNGYDIESEAEANGRYVVSETEVDGPRACGPFRADTAQDDSRIDYSRIFDGGVLYWTAENYSTLGPSRPNSLSSNDSMWMRREADISFIVDDIAGASFPGTESPTSLAYVAADVSPAPSERAASPLPAAEPPSERGDPPESVRRMPRVRAVRLQGSRPSPILVRANLAHTPPRSIYRGLSPDLRYTRGLSPDTFVRHLPNYQAAPLARQGSVGAAKDGYGGGVRWKRPTSPVLRFSHAPSAVPPPGDVPRARPANARSGSSSPRHWAPALDGRSDADKASGVDAEGTFRGFGPDFSPGTGFYSLGEKLAAVAGSGGFGRNPLVKKGLPPLAPVTHPQDQDHPDVLVPIHHWVTLPLFKPHPVVHQEPPSVSQDSANPVTNLDFESRTERPQEASHPHGFEAVTPSGQGDQGPVNPPRFGDVTSLQPVVLISPLTPMSPPALQQPPPEWALFHDLLHKEVEQSCSENREEMASKRPFQLAAITKVSKALQVLWPRSRITVFGSFITGLALPTSDIDLLVGLPPVRSLEPIKEAGILEGRNGIKETMLQHAARYLADQDWVKTDSMKIIENTAVPIIQLVARMPLQPLQASGSPGEKSSPQAEATAQNRPVAVSPGGSPVESRSVLVPSVATSVAEKGTAARGEAFVNSAERVAESGAVASTSVTAPGHCSSACAPAPSQSIAHMASSSEKSAPNVAALGADVTDPSLPAVESARGIAPGPVTNSSRAGETSTQVGSVTRVADATSVRLPSARGAGADRSHRSEPAERSAMQRPQELPGGGRQPEELTGVCESSQAVTPGVRCSGPCATRIASGGTLPNEDPSTALVPAAGLEARAGAKSAAVVSGDVSSSGAEPAHVSVAAADVKQGAADRGLDGRRHSAPQQVLSEAGLMTQADVSGAGWRGHVSLVRTRADVAGHVEGAGSLGDQERRLVKLDISFEGVQHTGSRTTDLVRELVAQFPPLPPLVLVLKQFLTDRSLDHPYTGGLSSYCLVLLVTRFLQHQQHVSGVRAQQAGQNLGLLLMDFLHFFGCVFDPRRMGVSIRAGGMYIDRDKGHSIDPLYIEDPLNPLNNVGRNCFRILQCTKAFGEGYVLLSKQLNQLEASAPQASLFSKILTKCG